MPFSSSLNATQSGMMTSSINGGAILMLIICIVGIAGFMLLISSLERYTKFWDTLYKVLYTLKYTAFGTGIVIVGYFMYIACSALAKAGGGIEPIVVGQVIAAYVVITAMGYAASLGWKKLTSVHAQYVASKEIPPTT